MSTDLPEPDWKIFRKLREVALGRFCERILAEVERIASDTKQGPHARYLAIFKLIQERDNQVARAFNNPRRSIALLQLGEMLSLELIREEELRSFSSRTQDTLEVLRPT
jgi:hypothetical protein